MNRGGNETLLMIASALLWLAIVVLGGMSHWLAALYALLTLVGVYTVLGAVRGGRVDVGLVVFPGLLWLGMWAIAFVVADLYAVLYQGRSPDHTFFGFHPSFAAIIVLYWLAPTAVMAFGFEAIKDRWLPEERWAAFVRSVSERGAGEKEQARD